MSLYAIGIDPGSNTGLAVWNVAAQRLESVETLKHVEALFYVYERYDSENAVIIFENANLRKWFGNTGREKLQGAGSVKARSSDWEQFCSHFGYRRRGIAPQSVRSIDNADTFKRVTGWQLRTSKHSRDAAVMVFGMSEANWRAVK